MDCDECTTKHAFEDAMAHLPLRTLRLCGDIPFLQCTQCCNYIIPVSKAWMRTLLPDARRYSNVLPA